MSEENTDIAQYVEQAAELLELEISPAFLPGVIDNFATIAKTAALVTEFDLSPQIEAPPVFIPDTQHPTPDTQISRNPKPDT